MSYQFNYLPKPLPDFAPPYTDKAFAATLYYVGLMAWPWPNQFNHLENLFLGGDALAAKAIGRKRSAFSDGMKGRKPARVNAKITKAFDDVFNKRWRAIAMASWIIGDGVSQTKAAERLVEWSREAKRSRQAIQENVFPAHLRGITDKDESYPKVRERIWRDSLPAIPMTIGFLSATGYLGIGGSEPIRKPMSRNEILLDSSWIPHAIRTCFTNIIDMTEIEPSTSYLRPSHPSVKDILNVAGFVPPAADPYQSN